MIIFSFWNIPNFVKIIEFLRGELYVWSWNCDLNSFCYVQMDPGSEVQPSIRRICTLPFSLSSLSVCVSEKKMDAVVFSHDNWHLRSLWGVFGHWYSNRLSDPNYFLDNNPCQLAGLRTVSWCAEIGEKQQYENQLSATVTIVTRISITAGNRSAFRECRKGKEIGAISIATEIYWCG